MLDCGVFPKEEEGRSSCLREEKVMGGVDRGQAQLDVTHCAASVATGCGLSHLVTLPPVDRRSAAKYASVRANIAPGTTRPALALLHQNTPSLRCEHTDAFYFAYTVVWSLFLGP